MAAIENMDYVIKIDVSDLDIKPKPETEIAIPKKETPKSKDNDALGELTGEKNEIRNKKRPD